MLKILLNAGNCSKIESAYVFIIVLYVILYVKIAETRAQSAGVRCISTHEASQRLNAGDLYYANIVGLFSQRSLLKGA